MIQRIQSIYLLLAAILMAVTAFSPLLIVDTHLVTSMGISEGNAMIKPTYGIVSTALLSALLSFVTIFFFKNRKKQNIIANVTIASTFFFYVTVLTYMLSYYDNFFTKGIAVSYGIVLPVLAIVLVVLAKGKIKKDEKLVRSLDRIR